MRCREKSFLLLIKIVLIFIAIGQGHGLNQFDSCFDPTGSSGLCVLVKSCPKIDGLLRKEPITGDDVVFIKQSKCGQTGKKALVCCAGLSGQTPKPGSPPRVSSRINLLEPPYCGVQQLSDRIVGGELKGIDVFPWLALLAYSMGGSTNVDYNCGGTLISDRYVLTAAHCVKNIPKGWSLVKIRLGEWNLETYQDCDFDRCADPVVDVPVEKIIIHENYTPQAQEQYNDIALIRMKQAVQFTDFVKPICLPIKSPKSITYDGKKMWTAGWGKTEWGEASSLKLSVDLPGVDRASCNKRYNGNTKNLVFRETQICAGGVKGKDSCNGDSGGPLMRDENPYWYQTGIVSFGPSKCGLDKVPGVYTNVASYTDWIASHMEP